MKTIHDTQGHDFRLYATVARDRAFRASRADMRKAVKTGTCFDIRYEEEPITPYSWRCSIEVTKRPTELEIGCHTFTGKDLRALRAWLRPA